MACSIALAVAVAAIWADLARLRSQGSSDPIDSVALFSAPVAGVRSRVGGMILVIALPVLANVFVSVFRKLDWNFLFMKLSVLTTWLAIFAAVHLALGPRERAPLSRRRAVAVSIAALALYQ